MHFFHSRILTRCRPARWIPVFLGLSACGFTPRSIPVPSPSGLTARVWALLGSDENSPIDFHRARMELEQLGPEIDTILINLAADADARPVARANALLLLAERRVPAALPTLQGALLGSQDETIREAAVLGLNRFVTESAEAQAAVRLALNDPSPRVRLNALQSLDVHDVGAVRALVRTERHALVLAIATQYLAISESRGAPLSAGADGVFRTAGWEGEPRLAYYPDSVDTVAGIARGHVRLEVPEERLDVVLAYDVQMAHGVLPAFFSPDRNWVVVETGRSIMLRDRARRETIFLEGGIAPRAIPFSDAFLYLRQRAAPQNASPRPDPVTVYEVCRVDFEEPQPQCIGEMRVATAMDGPLPLSPVRWMTVGETGEGWVLRVDGQPVFEAPHRLATPGDRQRPVVVDPGG
jgi:hypothetical protein